MQNREMVEALLRRDALERQQEILFDISFSLGANPSGPMTESTSDLMDWLGGSRGLFERVKTWATEFDKAWEENKAAGIEQEEYLSDIDAFTASQWAQLKEDFEADQQVVWGVQVLPYITRSEGRTVIVQPEGPDDKTEGWAVYTRDPAGLAHWFADLANEEAAMWVGEGLANKHSVKIENQPWKKKEQSDEQAS